MRLLLAVLAASVAFTGAALADPFANFYGNTTVVSNEAAGERKVLINEDGTYTSVLADGSTQAGTWEISGEQACFMQTEPAPAEDAQPYCVETAERAIGDSWEITAPDGTVESATLVEGR